MNIKKILATNMRKYRKAAGLTQEELAERCGLHRTYIGGIEQERINVSLNNIAKVAAALKVSPALLLMNSVEPAEAAAELMGDEQDHLHYAVCVFQGDSVTIQPINVQDINLDVQILCALVQDGVEDEAELGERFATIQKELLHYFKAHRP